MAVINIDTIGYKDAVQIELGSTSIKEKFEKFKDSSINMGRRVVVAGSMAESGTVRQTEAYYGYTKTLRPAAPIISLEQQLWRQCQYPDKGSKNSQQKNTDRNTELYS